MLYLIPLPWLLCPVMMISTAFLLDRLVLIIYDLGTYICKRPWVYRLGMTLAEWLKAYAKTDYHRHRPWTRRHVNPRRYLIRSTRTQPFRIADKRSVLNQVRTYYVMDSTEEREQPSAPAQFDSDSFMISVDNCASYVISNNKKHFVGPIRPIPRKSKESVIGIGDSRVPVIGKGTVLWRWDDDEGVSHKHYIRNSLYVPGSDHCLLSPQHWSQQAKDGHGTWCATYDDTCVLFWKQQRFKRTLKWDRATNTARFWSSEGALRYRVFAALHDASVDVESHEHVAFQAAHVIPPDDDSSVFTVPREPDEVREENLFDLTPPTVPLPTTMAKAIEDDEARMTVESP